MMYIFISVEFKGEGKRFLNGDLICTHDTYTVRIYIWHLCQRFMHYKRKT